LIRLSHHDSIGSIDSTVIRPKKTNQCIDQFLNFSLTTIQPTQLSSI